MEIIKSFFSFNGRAKRTAYWMGHICSRMAIFPLESAEELNFSIGWVLYVLFILMPVSWAYCSVAVKRFHDLGRSGWFVAFLCIPVLNIAAAIYLGFFKGKDEANEYGPSPY